MDGYQIVELASIDKLITCQYPLELQIALIRWLINYTKVDLHKENIVLELIKVEYVSKYPAIGIKYLSDDSDDLENLVITQCESALNGASVNELINFLHENADDIKKETAKF